VDHLKVNDFDEGAQVITANVALLQPYGMDAVAWTDWVETIAEHADPNTAVATWRAQLEAAGYDGITVAAWDGCTRTANGQIPCLETDASMLIAFHSDQVVILGWTPAARHLPVPASPAPARRLRPR